MAHKLTDEEIIAVLKVKSEANDDFCELVFDLVSRLQAEVNRLNTELKATSGAALSYKEESERYKGVIKILEKDVAEAKVEAYKEFAEMLKQYVESNQVQTTFFGDKCFIDNDTIDNFIKERIGEDNA